VELNPSRELAGTQIFSENMKFNFCVGFEFPTAVVINVAIFWD
jgi:hypothetical protein